MFRGMQLRKLVQRGCPQVPMFRGMQLRKLVQRGCLQRYMQVGGFSPGGLPYKSGEGNRRKF